MGELGNNYGRLKGHEKEFIESLATDEEKAEFIAAKNSQPSSTNLDVTFTPELQNKWINRYIDWHHEKQELYIAFTGWAFGKSVNAGKFFSRGGVDQELLPPIELPEAISFEQCKFVDHLELDRLFIDREISFILSNCEFSGNLSMVSTKLRSLDINECHFKNGELSLFRSCARGDVTLTNNNIKGLEIIESEFYSRLYLYENELGDLTIKNLTLRDKGRLNVSNLVATGSISVRNIIIDNPGNSGLTTGEVMADFSNQVEKFEKTGITYATSSSILFYGLKQDYTNLEISDIRVIGGEQLAKPALALVYSAPSNTPSTKRIAVDRVRHFADEHSSTPLEHDYPLVVWHGHQDNGLQRTVSNCDLRQMYFSETDASLVDFIDCRWPKSKKLGAPDLALLSETELTETVKSEDSPLLSKLANLCEWLKNRILDFFDCRRAKPREKDSTELTNLANKYERLKHRSKSNGNNLLQDSFHFWQLRLRLQSMRVAGEKGLERLALEGYFLSSGFGLDIAKPLWWLAGLFFAFLAVYWGLYHLTPAVGWERFFLAAHTAFSGLLVFAQYPEVSWTANKAGCGLGLLLLFSLERALSVFLLFQLGSAIRLRVRK